MSLNIALSDHSAFSARVSVPAVNTEPRAQSDRSSEHPAQASVIYHHRVSLSQQVVYARPVTETAPVSEVAPGAVTAANNILSFIETQLQYDVADGASLDDLSSRIDAGLEGFLQGFTEAAEILGGEEGMTEGIWQEIGQTKALVLSGIEDLREKYTGERVADEPAASSAQAVQSSSYQNASKNSFQFQLVTADGDKVSIRVASVQASILETYLDVRENQKGQFQSHQSDRFALDIKGELDEGELAAINDLLSQVGDLAEEFFSGDVESAFQMATELGYDHSEIAQFALNLKHTSVQKVEQAYGQTSPQSAQPMASLSQSLNPLANYVEQLLEAYQTAQQFQQPLELLQSIAQGLEQGSYSRFSESMKLAVKG